MIILDIIPAMLMIFGIRFIFSEGQIGEPLVNYLKCRIHPKKRVAEKMLKPFFLCPPCMASAWGTIYYLASGIDYPYLVFIIALTGLNAFLTKYFNW